MQWAGLARRLVLLGAWVGALGMASIALARLAAFDEMRPLVIANSLTFWLYLPAYGLLVGGFLFRRFVLATFAVVLVGAHLLWVRPVLAAPVPIPTGARSAPTLLLFSANLTYDNLSTGGIIDEIRRSDADVVLLQEFSRHWERALRRSPVANRYPHQVVAHRDHDVYGMAILSRFPLRRTRADYVRLSPLLSATIEVGGRSVRIIDIHASPPVYNFERYEEQVDGYSRILRDVRGRAIVAGDFNTSPFNRWMRWFDDRGLRGAHELLGHGLATTWPNGERKAPPIRLDHVRVSNRVVPLRIAEGEGHGSDHKPLIVELAVLP